MKTKFRFFLLAAAAIAILPACNKDPKDDPKPGEEIPAVINSNFSSIVKNSVTAVDGGYAVSLSANAGNEKLDITLVSEEGYLVPGSYAPGAGANSYQASYTGEKVAGKIIDGNVSVVKSGDDYTLSGTLRLDNGKTVLKVNASGALTFEVGEPQYYFTEEDFTEDLTAAKVGICSGKCYKVYTTGADNYFLATFYIVNGAGPGTYTIGKEGDVFALMGYPMSAYGLDDIGCRFVDESAVFTYMVAGTLIISEKYGQLTFSSPDYTDTKDWQPGHKVEFANCKKVEASSLNIKYYEPEITGDPTDGKFTWVNVGSKQSKRNPDNAECMIIFNFSNGKPFLTLFLVDKGKDENDILPAEGETKPFSVPDISDYYAGVAGIAVSGGEKPENSWVAESGYGSFLTVNGENMDIPIGYYVVLKNDGNGKLSASVVDAGYKTHPAFDFIGGYIIGATKE